MHHVLARFGLAASLLLPGLSRAWQIDDPLHTSCHERLSHEALKQVGYVSPPPAPSGEDARLPGSFQFDASAYDANLYAWSLLKGTRYPDLHGAPGFDFDDLANVHNAAGDQGEHCLRSAEQDGAEGADEAALADCRRAIETFYWRALATLDAAGEVDAQARELLAFHAPGAGRVEYPLSGFYANAGRALHAIQDSFTHTYRSEDWHMVQHVFNWVDQVRCTLDEPKDGHGHESVLDDCEGMHPSNQARFAAASAASVQFLRALTEPGTREEREARLEQFFADWFRYQPGCTPDNGYCGNESHTWLAARPEKERNVCASGCAAAPTGLGGHGPWLLLGLALAPVVAWRRKRAGAVLGVALAGALAVVPGSARAEESPEAGETGPVAAVAPVGKEPGFSTGYHTEVRASISLLNPGMALGVTGKWVWKRAEVGVFAELNPWPSLERRRLSLGATNVGVQAHFLQPLSPTVRWRAGLGLGLSFLNEEMIGSNAGTRGVFLDVKLLGLVWNFSEDVALTVDGFDLALAAPQLVGWPVLYAQHRFSVGLQF
ncbi:MAG TPA: hypothetical protein VLQ93_03995 [Myxococcaceae bacterium]|nr:hypothetical protein [Myxococcaceae bacterium]